MGSTFGIDSTPGNASAFYVGELPVSGKSQQYLQQFFQNNTRIQEGIILDIAAGGYVAQVNTGLGTCSATWCSDTVSGLYGSGAFTTPQIGSHVLLYIPPSGDARIIGCLPPLGFGTGALYRALLGSKKTTLTDNTHSGVWNPQQAAFAPANAGRPTDIYPGDSGWFNEEGSLLGIFRGGVVQLMASELSQIQAFTIDDLLRVIARNYQFFNAVGETQIYDDEGYVNLETNISVRSYEPFGLTDFGSIGEEQENIEEGFYKSKDLEAPIQRISFHAGWLGDLLKVFCNKDDYTCVARTDIDPEGTIQINTTSGIILRRSPKIYNYERLKEPNDPEGNTNVTPAEVNKFTWNEEYTAGKTLEEKDYFEYKDEVYDNRRFDDYNKDWAKRGAVAKDEIDSVVHIREDGSIVLRSASGSSIELNSDGDVVISAARDVIVQPTRNYSNITPGMVDFRVKNNFTTSCDEGSVRLKSGKEIEMYADTGGILLEANGSTLPEIVTAGENQKSGGILLRTTGNAPILLESSQNNVQIDAAKHITVASQEYVKFETETFGLQATNYYANLTTVIVETSDYNLSVGGNTRISSNNYILSGKTISITGKSNCLIHAPGGVNVAHEHTGGEFSYRPDAHGIYTAHISKVNSPVIASLPSATVETIQDLVGEWSTNTLRNFKFIYRSNHRKEPLYYTYWQAYKDSVTMWDLEVPEINNTLPFPGKIYFVKYTETDAPSDKGGAFILTGDYPTGVYKYD